MWLSERCYLLTYKKYLLSKEWQEKRKKVFERALKNANCNNEYGICERCGYKPNKYCLQVHHRTYEHLFNEPLEDLELLCPNCHKAETKKQRAEHKEFELKARIIKSMQKRKIEYEITERLGNLSDNDNQVHKELNLISWNKSAAVFDLRSWGKDADGNRKPLKGLTLSADEVEVLRELLNSIEIA